MIVREKKVLLDYLIDSLKTTPEAWKWANEKKYYIVHSSGLKLWASNEIHVYEPNQIKFDWWDQRKLKRAFNQWKDARGNEEALSIERSNCRRAISLLRGDNALRAA